MFSVKIREHMMIAHSLPDDFFGPAQHLHGATYVVDVEFFSSKLNDHQVVIDIGAAHSITREILDQLNYKNLDDLEVFKGKITTTEYLAWYIHEQVQSKASDLFKGHIKVTLNESHVASASYSGHPKDH